MSAVAAASTARAHGGRPWDAVLAGGALLLALSPRLAAGIPPEPVQNLKCTCATNVDGRPVADLAWDNPPPGIGFLLEIRRDGEVIAVVQAEGPTQRFTDDQVSFGNHGYEVTVIDLRGNRSQPVPCTVNCEPPPPPPRPTAAVKGPQRLVLPPSGVAQAIFDARGSRDSNGGRALQYQWIATGAGQVDFLSPTGFVTRALFPAPGSYLVGVRVAEAPGFTSVGEAAIQVDVTQGGPDQPAVFFPIEPDFLVAVAGRPFEVPIMLLAGSPFPGLAVAGAPADLILDANLGLIRWIPPLPAAGKEFPLTLVAKSPGGETTLPFAIRVVEPAEPVVAYAFPLPAGGGGPAGDGGGGSLGPAPPTISDQAPISPSLSLELSPLAPVEACSVQLITAGGAPFDPFDGILFDPGCGGAGSAGVYFSGSSASKLLENITNDLTIEVWVSQVSAAPPPGGRAFIFSMSSGTAGINWLIGHDGGNAYAAVVRVNGVGEEVSVTAPPRADGLVNLVFVRSGDEHRVYVNGARAVSRVVPHADPVDATWDPSYGLYLGNSSDETRPFDGRFHFGAVYGEALSDALISFLDSIGPTYPPPDEVPAPIADICPDPREIRRGVDVDGTLSRSLLGGGGGGARGGDAGGGGGGGGSSCPEMLRPFEWTLTPSIPGWRVSAGAVSGEEACSRAIRIDYDEPPAGTRFDLEIELKVTQIPVRGIVKSDTVMKTIRLPTYFKRGDANQDDALDISDGIKLILSLFVAGHTLHCVDAGDANDDGRMDLSDAVYLFDALFKGGPAPPAPFPACGPDGTADPPASGDLGCFGPPLYCS